ncbi:hypothetical protein [Streptomyces sp. NPDC005476]|uniref:hypothetical protein n=1 Tax=Streptomyces sp. NPDC005476 TaxID=3156882 RepID=UPI0034512C40
MIAVLTDHLQNNLEPVPPQKTPMTPEAEAPPLLPPLTAADGLPPITPACSMLLAAQFEIVSGYEPKDYTSPTENPLIAVPQFKREFERRNGAEFTEHAATGALNELASLLEGAQAREDPAEVREADRFLRAYAGFGLRWMMFARCRIPKNDPFVITVKESAQLFSREKEARSRIGTQIAVCSMVKRRGNLLALAMQKRTMSAFTYPTRLCGSLIGLEVSRYSPIGVNLSKSYQTRRKLLQNSMFATTLAWNAIGAFGSSVICGYRGYLHGCLHSPLGLHWLASGCYGGVGLPNIALVGQGRALGLRMLRSS